MYERAPAAFRLRPRSLINFFTISFFLWQNAFDVSFPAGASADEKAILVGSTLLLNAVFFETDN